MRVDCLSLSGLDPGPELLDDGRSPSLSMPNDFTIGLLPLLRALEASWLAGELPASQAVTLPSIGSAPSRESESLIWPLSFCSRVPI